VIITPDQRRILLTLGKSPLYLGAVAMISGLSPRRCQTVLRQLERRSLTVSRLHLLTADDGGIVAADSWQLSDVGAIAAEELRA
jgi:hypothetical protein